ncbi:MAG: hypothetical protein ACOYXR_08595 [Nitrospirota bacterium]
MTTYLSAAFLQQCFAMHRYDLVVNRLTPAGVVVSCRQCRLRHAVRLGPWQADSDAAQQATPVVGVGLLVCAAGHLPAVCVQNVDVQRDHVQVACKECRTTAGFRLAECVTRDLGGRGAP